VKPEEQDEGFLCDPGCENIIPVRQEKPRKQRGKKTTNALKPWNHRR
jgi:hypothetical protein